MAPHPATSGRSTAQAWTVRRPNREFHRQNRGEIPHPPLFLSRKRTGVGGWRLTPPLLAAAFWAREGALSPKAGRSSPFQAWFAGIPSSGRKAMT